MSISSTDPMIQNPRVCRTHHLQLVLPELLLPGLVEEREIPHMVDEDVAKDGELRIDWGDLAEFRLERGTEATEGSWGIQLGDFLVYLAGKEFSLEVCCSQCGPA